MQTQIDIGDIRVDVTLKAIKNIHLSVYPPYGAVRISAPERMSLDHFLVYAISRLAWIRQQQRKLQRQARETPREYLDRESHYLWGNRYLLQLTHHQAAPSIHLAHRRIILRIRPDTDVEARRAFMEKSYRQELKAAVPSLIGKWQPLLNVKVNQFFVQRMKTKWGACATGRGNIRLNSELAKKNIEYLEYIVVHEMAHLRVRQHNDRFRDPLDRALPNWRLLKQALDAEPLSHVEWKPLESKGSPIQ